MNDPQTRVVHNYHRDHRDLYKSPGIEARHKAACSSTNNSPAGNGGSAAAIGGDVTMSWRAAYKKRCLEETKKSRQKLLHKFRNLQLQEPNKKSDFGLYLDDELRKICVSEAEGVVSLDEAIEMYSQIRAEMMQSIDLDVSRVLDELDSIAKRDGESAPGVVDDVVCPVCQKERLEMTDDGNGGTRTRVIECRNHRVGACTLKFDASTTDIRDLNELAARLQARIQQHPCAEVPKFLFRFLDDDTADAKSSSSTSANSLLVYCDMCGFMQNIF